MRVSLGDVCAIEAPLVDPRQPEYRALPHIGVANIEAHTGQIGKLRTAEEDGQRSSKFLFTERDVLYSKIRPYLRKVASPGFTGLCSADVYPLRPRVGRLDPKFLHFLLLSDGVAAYAASGSRRAQMPKVNRKHLFAFDFELPSLSEQRLVVSRILDAIERMDEIRNLRADSLRAARALAASARFEAFRDLKNLVSLGDVIDQGPNNGLYKPAKHYGSGNAILRINDFHGGDVYVGRRQLRRLALTETEMQKFGLHAGDIVVNRVNGSLDVVGKACLVGHADEPVVFESNMMRFSVDSALAEPRYVLHFLASPQCRDQIKKKARVINQASINQSDVKSFSLPLPSLGAQEAIADRLDEVVRVGDSLRTEFRDVDKAISTLPTSVLRRAFAGEL